MINRLIKLSMLAILSTASLHAEVPAPEALNYTAKAELATALLSGPLAGYAQHKKITAGKSDNKALVAGLASDFISIANNSLAFFNAYKKGDLYKLGKDGKNAQQWLTLMWILQDICNLGKTSKDLVGHIRSRNDSEAWDKVEEAQETLSKSDEEKLTNIAKTFVIYVLPAIKTIAASARAYDSITSEKRTKDQELVNYVSFIAIAGCASLSEYLESKQGSAAYYLAIAKSVICATAILVDAKMYDIRKDATIAAKDGALTAKEEQRVQDLAAAQQEAQQHEIQALEEVRQQAQQEVDAAKEQANIYKSYFEQALSKTQNRALLEAKRADKAETQLIEIQKQADRANSLDEQLDYNLEELETKKKDLEKLTREYAEEQILKAIAEQEKLAAIARATTAEEERKLKNIQLDEAQLAAEAMAKQQWQESVRQEFTALGLKRENVARWAGYTAREGALSDKELDQLSAMRQTIANVLTEKDLNKGTTEFNPINDSLFSWINRQKNAKTITTVIQEISTIAGMDAVKQQLQRKLDSLPKKKRR